jgi:hypothetical protein
MDEILAFFRKVQRDVVVGGTVGRSYNVRGLMLVPYRKQLWAVSPSVLRRKETLQTVVKK